MVDVGLTLAPRLALIVAFLVAIGGVVLGLTWILGGPWWPTVAFQAGQRGKAVHGLLWKSFLVAVVPSTLMIGASGLASGVLLWVIFAPRWIGQHASANAWNDDEDQPDLRHRALEVRNRRNELLGQPALDGAASWPEYIIDAAKAERQRIYQERFERDGREDVTPAAPSS